MMDGTPSNDTVTPSPANGVDLRRSPRKTVLKRARIIYNDGHCTLDCTIRNISETGARLEIPTYIPLPETITLMFQDGRRRPAEIVWSKMTRLGVHFLDVPDAAESRDVKVMLLQRVRQVEEQIDELRDAILIHLGP